MLDNVVSLSLQQQLQCVLGTIGPCVQVGKAPAPAEPEHAEIKTDSFMLCMPRRQC